MRHRKGGKRLGRTTAHRKAMLRNLVASLFLTAEAEDGPWRIATTIPKAKVARRLAERCITLGKRALREPGQALHARRRALALLSNKRAVRILFETIAPLYSDRQGGYTRILRLASRRLGDGADLCYFELIREPVEAAPAPTEPVAPRRTASETTEPTPQTEAPAGQEGAETPDGEQPDAEGDAADEAPDEAAPGDSASEQPEGSASGQEESPS